MFSPPSTLEAPVRHINAQRARPFPACNSLAIRQRLRIVNRAAIAVSHAGKTVLRNHATLIATLRNSLKRQRRSGR